MSIDTSSRKLVLSIVWILVILFGHAFGALALTSTRLTTDPARDLGPVWSPDGTTLAFLSDRNGNRDWVMGLWTVREDGSNLDEVAQVVVTTPLSWLEEGIHSVAWLGNTGDLLLFEQQYIVEFMRFQLSQASALPVIRSVRDGDSSYMKRLLYMPGGKGGSSPTASPTGSQIAWTASVDIPRTRFDIRIYEGSLGSYIGATDSAGTLLLRTDSGGYAESREALAFSPDGTKLCACVAMSGWPNGQGRDLYVIDLLTSAVTRITTSGDSGIDIPDVTWSSENVIAFCAGQRGSWGADSHDLYTIRSDGTGLCQLTDTAADEITPNWSPDGTRLAFASNEAGNYDIYIMEMNIDSWGIPHTVTVSADPAAGGTATGGGTYDDGATVTVVATPNAGYEFVHWTESGTEVSTEAAYAFSASADRSLVADFALSGATRLNVPYYDQGNSDWCWAASMSMILRFYGVSKQPWEIAAEFGKGPQDGAHWLVDWNPITTYLEQETGANWVCQPDPLDDVLKTDLVRQLRQGRPVLLIDPAGIGHAIVVTGFSGTSSSDCVFFNDPSGYLGHGKIAAQMGWDDFLSELGGWGRVSRTLFYCSDEIDARGALATVSLLPGVSLYFRNSDNTGILSLLWDGTQPHLGYIYGLVGRGFTEDSELGYSVPFDSSVRVCAPTIANAGTAPAHLRVSGAIFAVGSSGNSAVCSLPPADVTIESGSEAQPEIWSELPFSTLALQETGMYELAIVVTERASGELQDSCRVRFRIGSAESAPGDVDGDGRVSVVDIRFCFQIATGYLAPSSAQYIAADVDRDGDVDMDDVRALAEYVVGIRAALP